MSHGRASTSVEDHSSLPHVTRTRRDSGGPRSLQDFGSNRKIRTLDIHRRLPALKPQEPESRRSNSPWNHTYIEIEEPTYSEVEVENDGVTRQFPRGQLKTRSGRSAILSRSMRNSADQLNSLDYQNCYQSSDSCYSNNLVDTINGVMNSPRNSKRILDSIDGFTRSSQPITCEVPGIATWTFDQYDIDHSNVSHI